MDQDHLVVESIQEPRQVDSGVVSRSSSSSKRVEKSETQGIQNVDVRGERERERERQTCLREYA